ncbi:MAG: hypothetical protein RR068_08645, partial [Hafnia sp.]
KAGLRCALLQAQLAYPVIARVEIDVPGVVIAYSACGHGFFQAKKYRQAACFIETTPTKRYHYDTYNLQIIFYKSGIDKEFQCVLHV